MFINNDIFSNFHGPDGSGQTGVVRKRCGVPPPQHALDGIRAFVVLLPQTHPFLTHTILWSHLLPIASTTPLVLRLDLVPSSLLKGEQSSTAYVVQHQRLIPGRSQRFSIPHRVPTKSNNMLNFLFSIRDSLCFVMLFSHTYAYVVQHQQLQCRKRKHNNNNAQADTISSPESVHTIDFVLTTTHPMKSTVFSYHGAVSVLSLPRGSRCPGKTEKVKKMYYTYISNF